MVGLASSRTGRFNLFTAGTLIAVLLSSASHSQILNAHLPQPSNQATSPPFADEICISSRIPREKIMVGQGPQKIELTLGGGHCEPPGSHISDLIATFPGNDHLGDVVKAHNCPAFKERIDGLWSRKNSHIPGNHSKLEVQAGSFSIQDTSDLFELTSNKGRAAAARWIREMLFAVRPCWNSIRNDRTWEVVNDLYKTLGTVVRE